MWVLTSQRQTAAEERWSLVDSCAGGSLSVGTNQRPHVHYQLSSHGTSMAVLLKRLSAVEMKKKPAVLGKPQKRRNCLL